VDIWYMIYDIWYLISDTWYMIYDNIWYIIIYICRLLFNSRRFCEVQRTGTTRWKFETMTGKETKLQPAAIKFNKSKIHAWICTKSCLLDSWGMSRGVWKG
jgi:hypothetical protein